MAEIGHPAGVERLRGSEHNLHFADRDGQDPIAQGIGMADHLGHGGHINLHRIDLQIRQFRLARQPVGQHLEAQWLGGIAGIGQLQVGDQDQRMQFKLAACGSHIRTNTPHIGFGNNPVGKQCSQCFIEIDTMLQAQRKALCRSPDSRLIDGIGLHLSYCHAASILEDHGRPLY